MEIEIVTTEKKLTKNIVNQLPFANLKDFTDGKVLGHISNIHKECYDVVLIENNKKYSYFPLNWQQGDTTVHKAVYMKGKKWSTTIDLETKEACQTWWDTFIKIKEKAFKTQIFI